MRRQRVGLFLTLILLLALGVGLLRGQQVAPAGAPTTPTVGTPVAQPSTIVVNQTTLVTVTNQIPAPSSTPVVPGSVKLECVDSRGKILATLGTMVDDGTQGDAVARDGIFTLRVAFTEPTPGTVRLQVSATFRAGGQRITSAVALLLIVGNTPPVANAGPDQTVVVGQTVTLDGSASTDADGDPLQYRWSFVARPTGSQATLSDSTLVHPTFVVDRPGMYTVQLLVNDGKADSAPDAVAVTTINALPVANAGPDQTVLVGQTVTLDGSQSSDVDGDALSHRWSFTIVPTGSQANLSDPMAIQPTFVVDLPGTYVVQLIVNDGTLDSTPATVRVTTVNRPPILASIGNRTVVVGNTLVLQLAATDPDGDPLTFAVDPLPANASLDATTGRFIFTPGASQVGTLVLTFKVSDGQLTAEAPITVTVTECQPPTITAITPLTGPVGTEVTITGTNLNCGTAQTLTLNGVPAVITSLSPTEIKTSIPLGGEGGLFTFSTPGGTITVPQTLAFDVVLSRDFALAVMPGSGQVLQGATTTYTVELQRLGAASFTGLAALAVTGVPSGVTATLASPMLTAGQKTTLTVSANTTALVGTSTLTLQATATVDTKPVTRTATFVLDVQAGGRTAVVGQFTFLDGTPLAGVKLHSH